MMHLESLDMNVGGTLVSNNSTLLATSEALRSVVFNPTQRGHFDTESFTDNYFTHSAMITNNGSSSGKAQPICYFRFERHPATGTINSSSDISLVAREYYDQIEGRLLALNQKEDGVQIVDDGAVKTALTVVDQLKRHQVSPPELSWHGGDAVVMLWALGDTTYAITVTDGELGYVVRRNRRAIKMADSISLEAFKLEDLR